MAVFTGETQPTTPQELRGLAVPPPTCRNTRVTAPARTTATPTAMSAAVRRPLPLRGPGGPGVIGPVIGPPAGPAGPAAPGGGPYGGSAPGVERPRMRVGSGMTPDRPDAGE